nr:PREDICTED: tripartite motif-containing protein 35-like [Latimeria chalumnae]|eukprot:XP_014345854.1 PREDICTED: tripartite motif-containing protein 35-like [Latimeria chalumnae]
MCNLCHSDTKHQTHKVESLQRAAEDYKEEIRALLGFYNVKLENLQEARSTYYQILNHIRSQEIKTGKQINDEFRALHEFLCTEERCYMNCLEKEAKWKYQQMEQKIVGITMDITSLEDTIDDLKELIQEEDCIELMKIEKFLECRREWRVPPNTVSRAVRVHPCYTYELKASFLFFFQKQKVTAGSKWTAKDTKIPCGSLIDVAKYLGSLTYRVWRKMQDIVTAVPITLDPNTASSSVLLTEGLAGILNNSILTQNHYLPENPERFEAYSCILGSKGFLRGYHCWDVDVRDAQRWNIGVAVASANRKMPISHESATGYWFISLSKAGRYAAHGLVLKLDKQPERIRVRLDCDRGTLSFTNTDDFSPIYTFSEKFTEKVYPYFFLGRREEDKDRSEQLRICPLNVCIYEKAHI